MSVQGSNRRHHIHFTRYESRELQYLIRNASASLPEKVCNMNEPTLWPGWHGFDLHVISNSTEKWCKCLQVCVRVKGRLFEYLVLLQSIHIYILMY